MGILVDQLEKLAALDTPVELGMGGGAFGAVLGAGGSMLMANELADKVNALKRDKYFISNDIKSHKAYIRGYATPWTSEHYRKYVAGQHNDIRKNYSKLVRYMAKNPKAYRRGLLGASTALIGGTAGLFGGTLGLVSAIADSRR